jgi:hypothetical protein
MAVRIDAKYRFDKRTLLQQSGDQFWEGRNRQQAVVYQSLESEGV